MPGLMGSDARFRELIEAAPAPIWMADADGGCTYANAAWLRFRGRTLQEELGDGWWQGVHPDDRERYAAIRSRALAEQAPFVIEYRLAHHDGGHRWVADRGSPVGRGATFTGMVGVCTDVHDRRVERERHVFLAELFGDLDAVVGAAERLELLSARVARRKEGVCIIDVVGEGPHRLRRVGVFGDDPRDRELAERCGLPEDQRNPRTAPPAGLLRDGAALWVGDPELAWALDGAAWRAVAARGPRSVAAVPLRARGHNVGSMVVVTTRRRLDGGDLAFLEDIAARAALALDNARLFGEAENAAHRFSLLQTATAALSSAASPDQVGEVGVAEARRVLGVTAATMFEMRGRELVQLARTGWNHPPEGWTHIPLDVRTPVSDAARTRAPVWLDGIGQWTARYPDIAEHARIWDLRFSAALPLTAGSRVVGAMAMEFPADRRLTPADLDAARLFAEACGQTLARARLQREADTERTWAELRAEASLALEGGAPEHDRLRRFARRVVPHAGDAAWVTVTDADGGPGLTAGAWTEPDGSVADGHSPVPPPVLDPVVRRVLGTGRTELDEDGDGEILSAISVPLGARGTVSGVLTIQTTAASGRRLGSGDLARADELGRRAGLALDAARRVEGERTARASAERAKRRTERLQRITAALSACLTERSVAHVVLAEGMEALGAVGGTVVTRQGDEARVVLTSDPPGPEPSGVLQEGDGLAMRVLAGGRDVWDADAGGAPALGLALHLGPVLVGALVFRMPPGTAPLVEGDRSLARAIAGQCALALERARLFEAEHRTAEILQRALLPRTLPQPRGTRLDVRYVGAAGERAGGDFYDVVELPDGAVAVVVGDVVGHGAEAAAVMGQLRSAWRVLALETDSPAVMLERLSRFAAHVPGAAVATVACATLREDTLRYACAGHPPPLMRSPDGVADYLMEGRGPPLTVGIGDFGEGVVRLEAGALVLLYTDGIIERTRDIEAGMRDLAALVAAGDGVPEHLLDTLGHVIGPEPLDDCAMLAIQVGGITRMRRDIPADAHALRGVRADLSAWLREHGVDPEIVADLVVAVDEALSNSLEHAYAAVPPPRRAIRLTVDIADDRSLAVTVGDSGVWRAPAVHPGLRGRGLSLMRAIMDRIEVVPAPDGTTVRMWRDLTRAVDRIPAGRAAAGAALGSVDGHPAPGATTLDPGPHLDAPALPRLRTELAAAAGRTRGLVVDLRGLEHLGSAGVRFLIQVSRDLHDAGSTLAVLAPPGSRARRVIDLAGVAGMLTVLDGAPANGRAETAS